MSRIDTRRLAKVEIRTKAEPARVWLAAFFARSGISVRAMEKLTDEEVVLYYFSPEDECAVMELLCLNAAALGIAVGVGICEPTPSFRYGDVRVWGEFPLLSLPKNFPNDPATKSQTDLPGAPSLSSPFPLSTLCRTIKATVNSISRRYDLEIPFDERLIEVSDAGSPCNENDAQELTILLAQLGLFRNILHPLEIEKLRESLIGCLEKGYIGDRDLYFAGWFLKVHPEQYELTGELFELFCAMIKGHPLGAEFEFGKRNFHLVPLERRFELIEEVFESGRVLFPKYQRARFDALKKTAIEVGFVKGEEVIPE